MSDNKSMPSNKSNQYSQVHIVFNPEEKAAKITLSDIGKNQNTDSHRWTKTIHEYHDFLIRH